MKKYSKKTIREAIAFWTKQLESGRFVSESGLLDQNKCDKLVETVARELGCGFVLRVGDSRMIPVNGMADFYGKLDMQAAGDLKDIMYDVVMEDPEQYGIEMHDDSDLSPEGYGPASYPDERQADDKAGELAEEKVDEFKDWFMDMVERFCEMNGSDVPVSAEAFLDFLKNELKPYVAGGRVDWTMVNGMTVFPIMVDDDDFIALYFRKTT